ncbi:MAG: prepilin-type N-terminal cleavage/methylation domain-containing protein [SAR324 cluster bacterium]|nr:prepilin-type N-terminal cleavage/methylation domain-containing protein [SAR324 cluster bacterium]
MKRRGFTLLELMVTMTLFAAIMGLLMNVFFQFKDQSTRFESVLSLRQEARILERLLQQDLQSAVYLFEFMDPKALQEDNDGRQSGIVGIDEKIGAEESDRIHMHVNRPVSFYRGLPITKDPEIHEVSYSLIEVAGKRLQFKRREQFYIDSDITDGDGSISHTLSENVVAFDLKYYRQNSPDPIEEWGTEEIRRGMKDAFGIPAGVAVSLKLQEASGETFETQFQINLQPAMGANIVWKTAE